MPNLRSTIESADQIKYDVYLEGISEEIVRKISAEQKEPERMLDIRLKSLEILQNKPRPNR